MNLYLLIVRKEWILWKRFALIGIATTNVLGFFHLANRDFPLRRYFIHETLCLNLMFAGDMQEFSGNANDDLMLLFG